MQLITLGTSCAQQTTSRSQSAHLLVLNARASYLVDCGSATGASLLKHKIKASTIRKIFLTHLHADHCIGLPALLADILGGHGGKAEDVAAGTLREGTGKKPVEIYGPLGTQEFLRTNFRLTYTSLASPFRVIELLFAHEKPYEGAPFAREEGSCIIRPNSSTDTNAATVWSNISRDFEGLPHEIKVDAIAIKHTVPTLGFIFKETDPIPLPEHIAKQIMGGFKGHEEQIFGALHTLKIGGELITPDSHHAGPFPEEYGRTVVILGDTNDASAVLPHLKDRVVSLVLHESTNAYLPPPYGKPKDTLPGVRERAESRGHSTPEMAGAFAQACNAQFLVLTHFSSRYYGSGPKARHWMSLFEDTAQLGSSASQKTVKAMFERDARLSQDNKSQRRVSERCQGGFNGQVLAAYDGMIVDIPPTGIMRPLVADEIPCHYTGDALYYHEFASEKCHLQKNLDKARKTP